MKTNWIRISVSLAVFIAVCVGAWMVGTSLNTPPAPTVISSKPGTQAAHLLRSDFKHPEPVVEVVAPVETGGGQTYSDPAPYQPTLCPPGTVANAVDANGNESNCQTPCNMWSDLDGDGVAETCTAAPYDGRRFNEV